MRSPSQYKDIRKTDKRQRDWEDIIAYKENHKESTKKPLKLIYKCSNVQDIKSLNKKKLNFYIPANKQLENWIIQVSTAKNMYS